MRTRAPSAGLIAALVLIACGWQTITQRLEREIFAESLELTMDRPSDLRPPDGLRVSSTEDRKINLAWDPVLVGDVAGYAILRSTNLAGPFDLIGRTTSRFGTVFKDRGETEDQLGDGSTYYYRVHPYDPGGRVSRSHAYIVATTEPRPDVPGGLSAYSNLPRKVVLVWEPNERRSTTGYSVLRSPTVAGPWERMGYAEGRLNSVFEDRVPGDLRVMYYRIAATNRFGSESDQTEPVRAVTKAEPLPPMGLGVADRRLGRVEIEWAPNVEIDVRTYEVWRSTTADEGWEDEVRIAEIGAPETRFADDEVGCGEHLRYRLRAVDGDGLTSGFSDPLETEGRSIDLRLASGPEGTARLAWDLPRADGWPAARVLEVRGGLPDRVITTVTGKSYADLTDVDPGEHRLAVVLTSRLPEEGSDGGRDDPPCQIEVEIR